ncbi:MAG: EamA family transporter [Candidatus Nomurabacteria bacterium]|nr:EamA family transporter [Candidatus Nomurabacteria bacterium]
MHWLLIAIWAPLLWALSNHIDKYLITRFGEGIGIRGLITFSALMSGLIIIISYVVDPNVFSILSADRFILMISGVLYTLAILLYLYALSHDEASVVTPTFQLIPVFAFFLGFIFLNEMMTGRQMLGGLVVILGAIIISTNFTTFKFRKKVFWLMISSSLAFAIYNILFKVGAGETFWTAIFWQSIGTFISGIFMFCLPSFRRDFLSIFKKDSVAIVGFSSLVEITTVAGNMLISKAVILAPVVAMVLMVESFQPIFVFVLGIIITVFIPVFGKEDLSRKMIIQKICAIAIILAGSFLLYF